MGRVQGREAVPDLSRVRFGVTLALRTVSDYLRRWGFALQWPVKRPGLAGGRRSGAP